MGSPAFRKLREEVTAGMRGWPALEPSKAEAMRVKLSAPAWEQVQSLVGASARAWCNSQIKLQQASNDMCR